MFFSVGSFDVLVNIVIFQSLRVHSAVDEDQQPKGNNDDEVLAALHEAFGTNPNSDEKTNDFDDISKQFVKNDTTNATEKTSNIPEKDSSHIALAKVFSLLNDEQHEVEQQKQGGCTFFTLKRYWFEMFIVCMVAICFFLLILCYGIIFRRIAGKHDSSGRKVKRLAITTLIFLGAFTVW